MSFIVRHTWPRVRNILVAYELKKKGSCVKGVAKGDRERGITTPRNVKSLRFKIKSTQQIYPVTLKRQDKQKLT